MFAQDSRRIYAQRVESLHRMSSLEDLNVRADVEYDALFNGTYGKYLKK